MALGQLNFATAPNGTLALAEPGPGAPPDGRLDFGPPPDGVLAFGTAGSGTDDALLAVDGDIGALDASITFGRGHRLELDADIGELAADIGLRWDANVSRGYTHRARSHWQDAAPRAAAAAARWQQSSPAVRPTASRWQDGAPGQRAAAVRWQQSSAQRRAVSSRWQDGAALRGAAAAAWQQATALRGAAATHWQDAAAQRAAATIVWQEMQRRRHTRAVRWQDGAAARRWLHEVLHDATPVRQQVRTHWQDARRPPPGRSWHTIPPQPPHLCYDPADLGKLQFGLDPVTPLGVLAFWCHEAPPPAGPIIVAPRRTWIVINSIELRRADDGTLLPCEAFAMQLDADSWTWSFSATIAWAQRAAVEPGIGGMPVELEAKVNGVPYRLQAERVGRSVRFPEKLAKVSGRGKAAILDAPYAAVQTFTNASAMTAQQIMEGVLTVGGVGIGWGLDFGLTDWVVPAGAWSHQGTYISALADIAGAVGGYLQPHATAATLRVLPRWPAPWWDWASATPDIILPAGVAEVDETEWIDQPAYNRIYVHGQAGGIAARITRTGTAGDVLKPTAVHPLITAELAARQRGVAELAASGRAIKQTITTMVLPATGLITPGKLVQYTDADATRLGLVRGTSVAWQFPALTQTLEIESHV